MSGEPVRGDTDAAIDFLKRWCRSGLWVLSADENGKMATRTFSPEQEPAARNWIDERQGKFNIYFALNPPRGRVSKKTDKLDMAAFETLHADLDPRAGHDLKQERLRIMGEIEACPIRPSVVIDSGGGYWTFWRLVEPIGIPAPSAGARRAKHSKRGEHVAPEDKADLDAYLAQVGQTEAYSDHMARAFFKADNCFNADRIARLPGTVNVPSEKKRREKGQEPALAKVVWAEWERLYTLGDFPKPAPEAAAAAGSSPASAERAEPAEWCRKVIADPLSNPAGEHDYQGHRSRAAFAICCELVRCGWTDDEIDKLLTDPANGISGHVLKQKPPDRYVKKTIEKARLAAAADFERYTAGQHKGEIIANSQGNIRLALARLNINVSFDAFANRMLIEGPEEKERRHLGDPELEAAYLMIDATFHFRPTMDFFTLLLRTEARRNSFHPVCDYLANLKWDGTPRVDTWLIKYGGAKDTPYTRAVGGLLLIAAVRRVRRPGCKFDEMVVLESVQGTNKSLALARLAVRDEWFSDSLPLDASMQKAMEAMAGKWIVEAGELQGLRKGDVEHLKAFMSRRYDRARMAYDRLVTEAPRQCVIVGTTNSDRYLRDTTGNRRFWPVHCEGFDLAALDKVVDQLWAEAAQREAAGESIRLSPSLYPVAAEEQEERRSEDPWEPLFAAALSTIHGKIPSEELWKIVGLPQVKRDRREQKHNERLGDAMRKLGWKRVRLHFAEGQDKTYGYQRGDAQLRERRLWIKFDDKGRPFATPEEPASERKNGAADITAEAAEAGEPEDFGRHRPPLGDLLADDGSEPAV